MAGSGVREEKLYDISMEMSKLESKKWTANSNEKELIQAEIEKLEHDFRRVMNPALFNKLGAVVCV